MEVNLKRAVGYGLTAFVVTAYALKVVTAEGYHGERGETVLLTVHLEAVFASLVIALLIWVSTAICFRLIPRTMNVVSDIAKMVACALAVGAITSVCLIGIGALYLMSAPQAVIMRAYADAAKMGVLVAVAMIPFQFFYRKGRARLPSHS